MKRTLKIAIGILAVAGTLAPLSMAAEPQPQVKAAILAAQQKWIAAVLHHDAATLEKLMSPDIVYTHSSATMQTRDEFIKSATTGDATYKGITFSDVTVRQFGKAAVVSHKAVFENVKSGESHLYITEVWAEQNGGWQMVSRQATKLPQ